MARAEKGSAATATAPGVSDSSSRQATPASPARLASVDFARGLTLLFMVLVNNPGTWDHIFAPLEHAAWNGFTPTDFVFPNFLFIAGASLAFALSRKRDSGEPIGPVLLRLLRRCALLFLIGVSITLIVINFDFAHLRIPGVLQRIALVSMACAALFLTVPRRALAPIAFGLLALYYVLMTLVPVPGIGPANLGAETNLGAWLDHALFGPNHLYRFTRTWDPEGLLSTVPAVSTGLFGLLAGLLLLGGDAPRAKLRKLILPGVILTVAGLAAHPLFPINKSLWTSSYVLFTSGLSCLFLAACYWAMDLRGWKRGTSLVLAFGMNSIFAYVASELFQTVLHKLPGTAGRDLFKTIYEGAFASWIDPPKLASVSWAIVYVGMIAIPVWVLYRKKIFLKL